MLAKALYKVILYKEECLSACAGVLLASSGQKTVNAALTTLKSSNVNVAISR